MTRRTVVISGASSGVGRSAALQLATEGWNVIGLGRDAVRCAEAEAAIRAAAAPDATVRMIQGDLASMAETRRMAGAVLAATDDIHALLNNAGGVRTEHAITPEGLEATFAANHLGPFLLTRALLPRLRDTARAQPRGTVRIIATSSEGHRTGTVVWDDPQQARPWTSGGSYSQAKLYNLLMIAELARREGPNGIVANAIHPGGADSNFAAHATPETQRYIATLDLISPDVGGRTLAWLAASAEGGASSDGYYFDRAPVEPDPMAHDTAAATRLWRESEALLDYHFGQNSKR